MMETLQYTSKEMRIRMCVAHPDKVSELAANLKTAVDLAWVR